MHNVIVVEGNNNVETIELYNGVMVVKVCHNSFDLTALIALCESNIQAERWLLLHDTCFVGSSFANLLDQHVANNLDKERVALVPFPSMSIGLYTTSFLQKHIDRLMEFKSFTSSKEDVIAAKKKALDSEDVLLWRLKGSEIGCMGTRREGQVVDKRLWNFNFGENRIQEYFPHLDLYKLKANYATGMCVTNL